MSIKAGEIIYQIRADQNELRAAMAEMKKEIDKLGRDTENKFNRIGQAMASIGTKMSIGITAPLVGLGIAAIKSSGRMELLTASFTTLLGSADKAASLVKQIKEMGAATPFNAPDIAQSTQTLLGFGVAQEEVLNVVQRLGDASQGQADKLRGLALVFGQVRAQGKMMGQDVYQFINNGVPIMQALADVTGKSQAELKKMMEQGEITADLVNKAFISMTAEGGQFYKGMENASKTLPGLLSTLKDDFEELLRNGIEPFMPAIRALIGDIAGIIKLFIALDGETKKSIVKFGALLAVVGPLTIGVGKFITSIQGAVTAFKVLRTFLIANQALLLGTLGPIALAVGAIAGLAYAYHSWIDNATETKKSVEELNRELEEQKRLQEEIKAENEQANKEVLEFVRSRIKAGKTEQEILGESVELVRKLQNEYVEESKRGLEMDASKLSMIETQIKMYENLRNTIKKMMATVQEQEKQEKKSSGSSSWWRDKLRAQKEYSDYMVKASGDQIALIRYESEEFIKEKEKQKRYGKITAKQLLEYKRQETIRVSQEIADIEKRQADEAANKIKEKFQKTISQVQQVIGYVQQVSTGISSIIQQVFSNQGTAIDNMLREREVGVQDWYKKQKDIIERTVTDEKEKTARLTALDEERARREQELNDETDRQKRQLQRQQAETQKAMSIFNIITSTAQAIMALWASVWQLGPYAAPIVGGIMSGVIGALSTAQIALVATAPLPALAEGGLATGATTALIGEGANPEVVLPLSTSVFDRLGAGIVSAMDRMGQGADNMIQAGKERIYRIYTSVQLDGKEVGRSVDEYREERASLMGGSNYSFSGV